jgi:hypothetical protein
MDKSGASVSHIPSNDLLSCTGAAWSGLKVRSFDDKNETIK